MPIYGVNALTFFRQIHISRRDLLIRRMTRQVLIALDYLHKLGIIHRDLKPSNILLQGDDFYLADFGLAKFVNESRTRVGTEWYMAPEVCLQNPQTTKVDIYGLGATIVGCYGNLPGPEERLSGLAWHNFLFDSYPSPLLATDPDKRASASDLLQQECFDLPQQAPSRYSGSSNAASEDFLGFPSQMEFSMQRKQPSTNIANAELSTMEFTSLTNAGSGPVSTQLPGQQKLQTPVGTMKCMSMTPVPNAQHVAAATKTTKRPLNLALGTDHREEKDHCKKRMKRLPERSTRTENVKPKRRRASVSEVRKRKSRRDLDDQTRVNPSDVRDCRERNRSTKKARGRSPRLQQLQQLRHSSATSSPQRKHP